MKALPTHYQDLTAAEKRSLLWERIEGSSYSDTELSMPSQPAFYGEAIRNGLLSVAHFVRAFTDVGDELRPGIKKIVHPVGAECQIELVPKPSPYTGIFRTGALGLARLSVIKPGTSFSPGSAFKFFVDGRPSLNIVTFRSAMGQGHNCNFFAFAQSNKISREFRPPVTVVKWMVQLALPRIDSPWLRRWDVLPVRHFGMITRKGEIEGAPRAPFEMIFQPTKEVQQSSDPTPDFRIKLRAIPAGATLFRVLARDTEGDETTTEIGVIRTASPFKSSRYGDERLFFQHDDGRSRKVAPA